MPRLSKATLASALSEASGNVAAAARRLGLARSTLHRRIQKSAKLQLIITDQRESLCDDAEFCIAQAVRDGDVKTAQWFLNSSETGRIRGYGKQPDGKAEADEFAAQPKIVEIVVESREQLAGILTYDQFARAKNDAERQSEKS